jgi:hypothetical protein
MPLHAAQIRPRNHFCRETLCRCHTPVPHHGNDGALPSNNPKQASMYQNHHTAQIRPRNHFCRETLRRFHTPVPHHGNDGALPSNNPKQASRYQNHHTAQIRLETNSGGKRSVVSTRRFHTMATTERCPPTIRSKLRGIKPITLHKYASKPFLQGNAPSFPHAGSKPWQRRSVALQQSEASFEVSNPSRCTNTPSKPFLEGNALSFPHAGSTPWQRRSVALQQSEASFEVSKPSRCTNTPSKPFLEGNALSFPHAGSTP